MQMKNPVGIVSLECLARTLPALSRKGIKSADHGLQRAGPKKEPGDLGFCAVAAGMNTSC